MVTFNADSHEHRQISGVTEGYDAVRVGPSDCSEVQWFLFLR